MSFEGKTLASDSNIKFSTRKKGRHEEEKGHVANISQIYNIRLYVGVAFIVDQFNPETKYVKLEESCSHTKSLPTA